MRECCVDGCDRPVYRVKDMLCRRHHDRKYIAKNGDTDRQDRIEENRELVQQGQKRCSKCSEVKTLNAFPPCSTGTGGRKSYCRECVPESYAKGAAGRKLSKQKSDAKDYQVRKKRRQAAKDLRRSRYMEHGEDPGGYFQKRDRGRTAKALRSAKKSLQQKRSIALTLWGSGSEFNRQLAEHMFSALTDATGVKHGPWMQEGISGADVYKLRYRHDAEFALYERLRRQRNKAARKLSIGDTMRSALKRGGDSPAVQKKLDYSIPELREHLERQFTKGMDWEAFKRGEIHIDHIIPVSLFNLESDEEFQACWALTNLQPLWAADNLRKSNRMEYLV